MTTTPAPNPQTQARIAEARAATARGWALTPLRGKIPQLEAWQRRPAPTEQDATAWAAAGNIGLRTGAASGIVVIDEDTSGDLDRLFSGDVPWTVTALTGSGKRHLYFAAPDPCPGNRARLPDPAGGPPLGVDIRGEGGQVVYVGSIHPCTGEPYRWAEDLSPDDVPLAPFPVGLLEAAVAAVAQRHPSAAPTPDRLGRYATAALEDETARVLAAPPGTRNDTLNRAAFALGQLVGGDVLPQGTVEDELYRCGLAAGLEDREIQVTIRSGITRGIAQPRRPQPRGRLALVPAPVDADPEAPTLPEVLIPGAHVDDQGTYVEIGADRFCECIISALPPGVIYRRDQIAGEIEGEPGSSYFRPLTVQRVRYLVDRHVRLVRWVKRKTDPDPIKVFAPCSADLACLVLDVAGIHPTVRKLERLVSYPVFIGDFHLATAGWNATQGVYYDEPPDLCDLETHYDPEEIWDALHDLVVDFPFKSEADRQNFFGLLLTPMLRPALGGNAPLHLIVAPLERTGKTYLAGTVLGGILLGSSTPAMQFGEDNAEVDKRILAMLSQGSTLVNIDNIGVYVDSPALSSLLTAQVYSARLLGQSRQLALTNTLTIVATGNNIRATGEVIKRSVPIQLQPTTDRPEARTDFIHRDLAGYVASVRRRVLGCLVSMVSRWRDGERNSGLVPKGGFESWGQNVGGILLSNGMAEWRQNEAEWARSSDPTGEDLRAFVGAWVEAHGSDQMMRAADLVAVAETHGLFAHALRASTERGRLSAFSKAVLARYCDTPVAGYVIRATGSASTRLYMLEPIR